MTNFIGKPDYAETEPKFFMHIIDFLLISKGIRIEAHDLVGAYRRVLLCQMKNSLDKRKERYRQIIADGNRLELIRMIKAIHFEKKDRETKGKNFIYQMTDFLKKLKKFYMISFDIC